MEYRMYCLAERHLSPVQKAIQSAHAIVDFIGYTTDEHAMAIAQWMDTDKTIIILDGGNSDDMETDLAILKNHNISFAEFHEPDMVDFVQQFVSLRMNGYGIMKHMVVPTRIINTCVSIIVNYLNGTTMNG